MVPVNWMKLWEGKNHIWGLSLRGAPPSARGPYIDDSSGKGTNRSYHRL